MKNGFGSTLMLRYKTQPPYPTSKKCKRGSYRLGKNCKECCLVSQPIGFRRCFNRCSSSFGSIGIKGKLKLSIQKRKIISKKITQLLDKPPVFSSKSYTIFPRSTKTTEKIKRLGGMYLDESKKINEYRKILTKKTSRLNKFSKKRKPRNIPPPLRKIPTGSKKIRYGLDKPAGLRRKAIAAGINSESKKRKISKVKAAQSKKGRLNVLRIYRRNSNPTACRKITMDMRWIDRTYLRSINGKTSKIC